MEILEGLHCQIGELITLRLFLFGTEAGIEANFGLKRIKDGLALTFPTIRGGNHQDKEILIDVGGAGQGNTPAFFFGIDKMEVVQETGDLLNGVGAGVFHLEFIEIFHELGREEIVHLRDG